MANYYMVCADCDYEFTVPTTCGNPFDQVCPKCSSKNICQRFNVPNEICIDGMKECKACPFDGNCKIQDELKPEEMEDN